MLQKTAGERTEGITGGSESSAEYKELSAPVLLELSIEIPLATGCHPASERGPGIIHTYAQPLGRRSKEPQLVQASWAFFC